MGASAYIGRIGGLAVALGIGAAIASVPWVSGADPGASPSPSSRPTPSASGRAHTAPRSHTNSATAGDRTVTTLNSLGQDRLHPSPTAAASSRLSVAPQNLPALGTPSNMVVPLGYSSGSSRTHRDRTAPFATSPAGSTTGSKLYTPISTAVNLSTAAATGNPIADFIAIFVSSGTAAHPNAGLLLGNGFSYDATTCAGGVACNGGHAGLLGNGGNGFNGGAGGSAELVGNDGAGGVGRWPRRRLRHQWHNRNSRPARNPLRVQLTES